MNWVRCILLTLALLSAGLGNFALHAAPGAVFHGTGLDFSGGANERYGAFQHGQQVNYVYAQPTGEDAAMSTTFSLDAIPSEPLFLHLKARDDDGPGACKIAVTLNGEILFEGSNEFPADAWEVRKIAIPQGLLKAGANEIQIANREKSGRLGMPPWFMVASCSVAPIDYVWRPDLTKDFFVTLPESVQPLPEPLAEGQRPGFEFRGIKGWMWRPEQYLEEIPVLVKYKMTFLMNCYGSMCDVENYSWGDPRCNRWWEDLPAWKKEAYEKIVRACQKEGLMFCFSMNPNICTNRIVDYDSAEDVEQLWKHYAWMQGLGVEWFNISLDDITEGIHASSQARVVNEIFRRLRENNPRAQMIFCPTYYWGDGTGEDQQPYLEVLARELHPEIYLFWTGDSVVGRITRKGAETFKAIAQHRLFLWDNYPVNDNHQAMHLAPVTDRDSDLCELIDGYMSNPMCTQNQANRLPLLTCADYAYNPKAYDPARSIGQAIAHLAETDAQRRALRDLVEAYPGMLIHAKGTGFNTVREGYQQLASAPHAVFTLRAFIRQTEDLAARLDREFPGRFDAAKKTLALDIAWLRQTFTEKYGKGALK